MLPECGPEAIQLLEPKERNLAAVFWWARQVRMGLKDRIANGFFVGPNMHKNKSGVWIPDPMDGCDNNRPEPVERTKKNGEKSFYLHPWAMWLHCLSPEHAAFMVLHRRNAVTIWLSHLGRGKNMGMTDEILNAIRHHPDRMHLSAVQAVRDITEHHHKVGNPFLDGLVPRPHGRYRLALKEERINGPDDAYLQQTV